MTAALTRMRLGGNKGLIPANLLLKMPMGSRMENLFVKFRLYNKKQMLLNEVSRHYDCHKTIYDSKYKNVIFLFPVLQKKRIRLKSWWADLCITLL